MDQLSEIGKTWFGGKNPPPPTSRRTSLPVNSYSPKHNHTASPSTSGINKQMSTVRLKICVWWCNLSFLRFLEWTFLAEKSIFWPKIYFLAENLFFGRKSFFFAKFSPFWTHCSSSSSSTSHAKHYPESSLNPALNQRKSNLNGNSRRPSLFTQTSQTKVQRSVTICGPMGVGKTSICNVLCNPNSAEHVKNTNSYRPTVEDEFVVNTKIKDEQGLSKNVQLTVLDTMGNDNQNMGVMVPDRFVTSKDGFIVVYSAFEKSDLE